MESIPTFIKKVKIYIISHIILISYDFNIENLLFLSYI